MVMRKFWVGLVAFCVTSAFTVTAGAVNVARVVALPSPHAVTMTIPGLDHIDRIVDAGHYSFAIAYDSQLAATVSFFDATKWQPARQIAGSTMLYDLVPAYPETGKTGEAWALLQGGALSHFDTKQWSTPISAKKILGISDSQSWSFGIRASGGYVFLQGSPTGSADDFRMAVYDPNAQRWSAVIDLKNYYELGGSTGNFVAFNDNNPHALTLIQPVPNINQTVTLVTVLKDGSYHLQSFNPFTGRAPGDMTAQFNRDYYLYGTATAGDIGIAYTSPTDMNLWTYLLKPTLFPTATLSGSTVMTSHYLGLSNNLICVAGAQGPPTQPNNSTLKLSCVNINDSQPQWQPPLTVSNNTKTWDLIVRTDGAWIINNDSDTDSDHLPQVFDYDFNAKKLIDTNFMKATDAAPTDVMTHALSATQLVVCQVGNLYVYDRNNTKTPWQRLGDGFEPAAPGCYFSRLYAGSHGSRQATSDFWAYDKPIGRAKRRLSHR